MHRNAGFSLEVILNPSRALKFLPICIIPMLLISVIKLQDLPSVLSLFIHKLQRAIFTFLAEKDFRIRDVRVLPLTMEKPQTDAQKKVKVLL